jgi:hypothetical protein
MTKEPVDLEEALQDPQAFVEGMEEITLPGGYVPRLPLVKGKRLEVGDPLSVEEAIRELEERDQ